MNTMRARLWQLVLIVSALGFIGSIADADTGGSAAAPVALPVGALAALVGVQLIAYGIRAVAPDNHFFHTKLGATLIAGISALLAAGAQVLQTRGLDKSALEWGVLNAALSFLTTGNPSLTSDNTSKKPDPAGVISGAATSLVFLAMLSAFMALPGCKTPAGQAAGKATLACELGQLPQSEQAVVADTVAIAMAGGANWQQQLESLGMTLAPGQFACLVQAIVAAWSAPKAALSPERQAALTRLQLYLNAHPATACAPIPLRACSTDVQPRG